MKKIIITLVIVVLAGLGVYFLTKGSPQTSDTDTATPEVAVATSTQPTAVEKDKSMSIIGTSVEGRDITAYHYLPAGGASAAGTTTELLFVGGIHGGYEWNTALVAYELMDYLKANPAIIPANIQVTVIPVLNPDGLHKVVGTTTARFEASLVSPSEEVQVSGRFNANTVDLNRNFDCDWQQTGVWQSKAVSGGSAAFSEPESQAVKVYLEKNTPKAVVVWYSAAGGVFASSCHNGVSAETSALVKSFAKASGYPAHDSFDFYAITGDMVNWLAKEGIPAISVLLTNHKDTEWEKNRAGVEALLKYYGN